jgi:hypothetical protein
MSERDYLPGFEPTKRRASASRYNPQTPAGFWDNLPEAGKGCTLEQLYQYICENATRCRHAERCAAQPVGDAWCFARQAGDEFDEHGVLI